MPIVMTNSGAKISATYSPVFNERITFYGGCVVYSTSSSAVASQTKVLSSALNLGTSGSYVEPVQNTVLKPSQGGSVYGVSQSGTLTLPTAATLLAGNTCGIGGTSITGTLGQTWTASSGSQGLSSWIFGGVGGVTYTGTASAGMAVSVGTATISGGAATTLQLSGGTTQLTLSSGTWLGTLISAGTDTLWLTGGSTGIASKVIQGSGTANIGGNIITPNYYPPHRINYVPPRPRLPDDHRSQFAALTPRTELVDE